MLTKLFFKQMIELTTGVVFLMSSLYGSGQANSHVDAIGSQMPAQVTAAVASSTDGDNIENPAFINDQKGMEAYLEKEYADTPVLVDIARCESNFRQFDKDGNIVRGKKDHDDVGVMQINEHYQGDTAKKLGLDLYTVDGNVMFAKHLYKEQGTAPWSASEKCWSDTIAEK